jgi:hypothetical protein
VVQIAGASEKRCIHHSIIVLKGLSSKHRAQWYLEARPFEVELTFANAMHQLHARNRNGCIPEAFEAEHCVDPGLDIAMILLAQIVRIL